jgi:hypothetical protein
LKNLISRKNHESHKNGKVLDESSINVTDIKNEKNGVRLDRKEGIYLHCVGYIV